MNTAALITLLFLAFVVVPCAVGACIRAASHHRHNSSTPTGNIALGHPHQS